MRKSIIAFAALLIPSLAISGGHAELGGYGTGVTVDTHVMEGKTGGLVMQTTQDVWIWENPPEGFPAASTATCNQYIAFGATPQPIGGAFVCRSVDPDGDVTLNTGAFQPDGSALITSMQRLANGLHILELAGLGKQLFKLVKTEQYTHLHPQIRNKRASRHTLLA